MKIHYSNGVAGKPRINTNTYDPNQPRDKKGYPTGGQWASASKSSSANVIGKTSGGNDIFDVSRYVNVEDFSTISVGITGKNKSRVIASKSRTSHNELLSKVDDNVDNFVRFELYFDPQKQIFGLKVETIYAGAVKDSGGEKDFDTRAFDNIYKASSILHNKGLPSSTPLYIKESGKKELFNTTIK